MQYASLQFKSFLINGGQLDLELRTLAVDDAQTFTQGVDASRINLQPTDCPADPRLGDLGCRAAAGVSDPAYWNDVPDMTQFSSYLTPDISPILQAVFDRPNWMGANTDDLDGDGLNNDLAILMTGTGAPLPIPLTNGGIVEDESYRGIYFYEGGSLMQQFCISITS